MPNRFAYPRPEYPRPDRQRGTIEGSDWLNLNGPWQFRFDGERIGEADQWFNDAGEWLQMDKAGHIFSAYMLSKYSRELWRWSGLPRKKQIWIGGMSGLAYQSVVELLSAL